MTTKPAAQLSLEAIIESNKAAAKRLNAEAAARLAENERIEGEMHKILSEPPPNSPPASRLVAAYRNGHAMAKMAAENAMTEAPPPLSTRMVAEREVLYAALAIVRSWQRRHKKTFKAQERELMNAVERLTWEK